MNMRKNYACLGVPFFLAMCSPPAGAQVAPPDSTSVVVESGGGLVAELSTERKTAALKARFAAPDDDHFFFVNLSGPFDEDSSTAKLGDLDGLAGSAAAEIGYKTLFFASRQKVFISLKAGAKEFKFVDSTDITKDIKENKTGYDISVGWDKFLEFGSSGTQATLLGLRLHYQRVYAAAEGYEICTPLPDVTATKCRTTGTAAPKKTDPVIAQAQAAYVFPETNIGLAITFAHDFEAGTNGIEVPIYLLRDEKTGLLNGGLKLSWQSETDEATAILFIGVPIGTL